MSQILFSLSPIYCVTHSIEPFLTVPGPHDQTEGSRAKNISRTKKSCSEEAENVLRKTEDNSVHIIDPAGRVCGEGAFLMGVLQV